MPTLVYNGSNGKVRLCCQIFFILSVAPESDRIIWAVYCNVAST